MSSLSNHNANNTKSVTLRVFNILKLSIVVTTEIFIKITAEISAEVISKIELKVQVKIHQSKKLAEVINRLKYCL